MTEPTLAERLAVDLDGAFEAVVLALQGPVYRFAYRYCGNAQDAEEIAQDAFVRAYGALRGYEPERIAALNADAMAADDCGQCRAQPGAGQAFASR